MGGSPAYSRRLKLDDLEGPFQPVSLYGSIIQACTCCYLHQSFVLNPFPGHFTRVKAKSQLSELRLGVISKTFHLHLPGSTVEIHLLAFYGF